MNRTTSELLENLLSNATTARHQPYEEVRTTFAAHPVRREEVPVEYSVSLPLPTLRWGQPVYAGFAGAALRTPGGPRELDVPDRWWAISVDGGGLAVFATTAAVPFTDGVLPGPLVIPKTSRSLSVVREELRMLDELMDAALPSFLDGTPGPAEVRGDIASLLPSVVSTETMPWYRALAPDFFAWLDGPAAS